MPPVVRIPVAQLLPARTGGMVGSDETLGAAVATVPATASAGVWVKYQNAAPPTTSAAIAAATAIRRPRDGESPAPRGFVEPQRRVRVRCHGSRYHEPEIRDHRRWRFVDQVRRVERVQR